MRTKIIVPPLILELEAAQAKMVDLNARLADAEALPQTQAQRERVLQLKQELRVVRSEIQMCESKIDLSGLRM